ncbi:MAG: hypothetical protein M3N53_06475 [Actinomycetota bacterium]|nr:hypothetical protein [Actinomycetota bacterium]
MVKKEYLLASSVGLDLGPLSVGGIHYFRRVSTDRFFTVKLDDASGMPVPAIVYQYLRCCDDNAEQQDVERRDICGAMNRPVKLLPRTVRISVAPQAGLCDEVPVAPTAGTISVRFMAAESRS